MPQGLATDPGSRQAPFRVPVKAPAAGPGPKGPNAGPRSAAHSPSAPDPVFDLDRTRAERAAAANFDESVSAVLYTPIHLNWVQF